MDLLKECSLNEGANAGKVIFDGNKAFVGVAHNSPPNMPPEILKKVKTIGDKYGYWYEGNGGDVPSTTEFSDKSKYEGSWDHEFVKTIKGYPPEYLYTLFANTNWFCNTNSNPNIVTLHDTPTAIDTDDLDGTNEQVYYFQFQTGIGDAAGDIPDAIKQAIKLIASDMYYFREDRKRAFPMASEILLQPYKCYL